MRALIAGNWKMHGTSADLGEIADIGASIASQPIDADVALCLPATLISRAAVIAGEKLEIGGETCHAVRSGAYTGETSAEMLADAGARWVILGHSERRRFHGETDAMVANKVKAAARAGLSSIVCVGESELQRTEGDPLAACRRQIVQSLPDLTATCPAAIAYEPIWAIGTGSRPTSMQISEMHAALREAVVEHLGDAGAAVRILFGGSVDGETAAEILSIDGVDGVLVGGSSLKARDFLAIARAAPHLSQERDAA
jgi:triosephosphate isomerase